MRQMIELQLQCGAYRLVQVGSRKEQLIVVGVADRCAQQSAHFGRVSNEHAGVQVARAERSLRVLVLNGLVGPQEVLGAEQHTGLGLPESLHNFSQRLDVDDVVTARR